MAKSLADILPLDEVIGSKVAQDLAITGVCADSRVVKPGEVFFAISGTQDEGHRYIKDALEKGAAAVIIQSRVAFEQFPKTVLVSSTRKSLGEAASQSFDEPSTQLNLVGVTGTNGKTTTSYLLKEIWEGMQIRSGLIGTVEYRIDCRSFPSTLTTPGPVDLQRIFAQMRDASVTNVVMEVSSIALDQERVAGSRFKVATFTNFSQDHLDYHMDMDNYFGAKTKLFKMEGLQTAVLNLDDPKSAKIAALTTAREIVTYSMNKRQADYHVQSCEVTKNGTLSRIVTPDGNFILRTNLIGLHNVQNCLAALATSHALHQPVCDAVYALGNAKGAPGRLERVLTGHNYPNVFVDYAHSDDALRNVLQAMHSVRGNSTGRIITVFGCGGDRDRAKRSKMARVASELSDITVATSDNPRTEDPHQILDDLEPGIEKSRTQYFRESDRKKAIEMALEMASPEDMVLVAGKGHETYQIIGTEKLPFDDRQVIREHYDL